MNDDIKDLVVKFIEGDQAAFEELVGRYKKKVYSIAYQMLGNHLDADEVAQETFVRLYNRRHQLKDVNYFSGFLMRIATNYSIDLIRKHQKKIPLADDNEIVSLPTASNSDKLDHQPDQAMEKKETFSKVRKAMEQLPPKQRITVILHDIEDFSKSEIAEIMDCPQATVRSNLHIARLKLKKILGSDSIGD
jgi:RNA polymerase sigma-70 factor (ECF subfamily)